MKYFSVIITTCIVWLMACGCENQAIKEYNDRLEKASAAWKESNAKAAIPVPKLDDTLFVSEDRALIFLKHEYGKTNDDIDLVAQQWYPAMASEVAKWRIRVGMSHVFIVTRTTLTGKNYMLASDWDVEVVNKSRH
jgi:hypothetical protein